MTKRILLCLIALVSYINVWANPVSPNAAMQVAQNFYQTTTQGQELGAVKMHLVQTITTKLFDEQSQRMEDCAVFYVFGVNSDDGFVLVAADDVAIPILAYGTKGHISANDLPENYRKWIESYKEEMTFLIQEKVEATDEIRNQWEELEAGTFSGFRGRSSASNLCQTTWGQQPYYNDMCPYDNSAGSRAVVGCVATAMAQVMKYWGHPAQGTGFHSYNHSTYGTQSVNYGNASYNWSAMPNSISSSNTEIAKIMYHCGVAVDMQYSPSGSGAYSSDAATALHTYFGYKSSLQYIAKSSYSQSSWTNLLRTEIDNNRPIYYAASGSGGGHAFVCDGYQANDYFHFNWGWRGSYDGFFHINSLNPSGVGTGGGSGGFNSNHRAIVGIEPVGGGGGGGTSSADMELYSSISLSASTINYGQSFTVSVDIANLSGTNFSGEVGAALLDNNNNFVDWIETTTWSLSDGFFNNASFSSTNMSSTPSPGSYNVVVYQKETGASGWSAIANGSYSNAASLQIQTVNSNGMELYDDVVVSTDPIVQGSAFTVSTNFYNNSSSNFSGKLSVDLHDMQGNLVLTIEEKSNMTLAAGFVYSNNIVFNSSGVSLSPGTYQIAAWMKPDGGNWELVGNGSYSNPIQIDITEPSIQGDIYENNNTASAAYTLPLNFVSNTATSSTSGSNIHQGGDYDYYKVVLPAGDEYSIDAQVFDSYNTSGGQYTNDVLFSYDAGSGVYSTAFDNSTSGIYLPNGGTVTFQVASYYQGQTGSYLFDLVVNKGPGVAVSKIEEEQAMRLYPVPANQFVTIDFEATPTDIQQLQVVNALGQTVYTQTSSLNQTTQTIQTADWTSGMYWLLIHTDKAITRKSFMVR